MNEMIVNGRVIQYECEKECGGAPDLEGHAREVISQMGDYCAVEGSGATLDGGYNIEELEAILWWLRNKPGEYFPR